MNPPLETPAGERAPLDYRFEVDPAETVRASREVARGRGGPWLPWAVWLILLVEAVLSLLSGARLRDLWLLGVAALLYGSILLATPWLQRRRLRRLYAGTPSLREPQLYRFSDEGLEIRGGPATTSLGWAALVRAKETREFFLLFYNERCAYYLPKRAMSGPADEARLRALLDARLGSRERSGGGVG